MAKSVRTITKVVENTMIVPKTILITQPKPETDKSPYYDLAKKYGFVPTFHSFVRVEGIDAKEFRKQKIAIENFSAVIFISRNAVDHFFRICEEMKIKVSIWLISLLTVCLVGCESKTPASDNANNSL